MKIGILSGTFDPVHHGHLAIAEAAINQQGMDRILFLVEKSPRRKKAVTPYQQRARMLELAIACIETANIWHARESRHSHKTLLDLAKQYPDDQLFLLVGSDVARQLEAWRFLSEIRRLADILVVSRERAIGTDILLDFPVSSRQIRQDIRRLGKSEDVPPPVLDYIREHELYR